MRVVPVACLRDNYAYLVIDGARAAVVDPSEAAPVLAAARRENVTIEAIWCTHHHLDHTGGNEELVAALGTGVPVLGHRSDALRGRVPGLTRELEDGDEVVLGELRARVMHVPGHTTGAVAYVTGGAVFTGDTLFGAGCGRLFEGTPAMMWSSLSRLASLPADTLVYCGHEYTAANLKFAAEVEPSNAAVGARAAAVAEARAAGQPSVPSTIAEERATNPFLRGAVPVVAAAARAAEPDVPTGDGGTEAAIFARLRRWKDRF